MYWRTAVALFLVLIPAGAIGGTASGGATASAATLEGPPAFDRWLGGPVQYLMSEKEKKIAAALSSPQHANAFRHWFWERRDPTPGTLENEFRVAFEARVDYVNKEYGDRSTGAPGWLTPKGVVHILLGAPTRISRASGKVYGDFDTSDVEVWTYELDDASVLDVPFVRVANGFAVLTAPGNLGMYVRLDETLRRTTMGFIRNRDLPFTGMSPLVSTPPAPTWPATGSACLTDAGLEGQLSIPLVELLGRPEGDDLRVDLRVEVESSSGRHPSTLGTLSVLLRREVFERWGDRALTVALWLPEGVTADADSRIVITEVASGREIRLQPGTRSEAVAQAYAVEELVGSARLADGDGAAFAFIGEAAAAPDSRSSMWVLRLPQQFDGIVLKQAAANLGLVRRQ